MSWTRTASRPIFLLAPTTPESRIAEVARFARGFVYYVSLKGVTGASHLDTRRSRASSTQSAGT
jgi:tryptophan synthase alpha subunit